jgi:hypothetical protein
MSDIYNTTDDMFVDWMVDVTGNSIDVYVKLHSDVTYRIYLGSHLNSPAVICVQSFDLIDYEDAWYKVIDEIVELEVSTYHYFHQDSMNPDADTKLLVENYMMANYTNVLKQYEDNKSKHYDKED